MVRESNQTPNTPFRSKTPCMSRTRKKIQALFLEKTAYATLQDHLGDTTVWAFVWKQRRREVKVEVASDGSKFSTRFANSSLTSLLRCFQTKAHTAVSPKWSWSVAYSVFSKRDAWIFFLVLHTFFFAEWKERKLRFLCFRWDNSESPRKYFLIFDRLVSK